MFTKILNISMRSTLIVVVLLILTRLLGKKQMSQLTYFNYITGVTMGSVAGDFISEVNMPVVDALASLIAICILTELNSFIALKSTSYRKVMDGDDIILIKKGKIIKPALKSCRMSVNILLMLLRQSNTFSVEEVEYAILETNGSLSVMKRQQAQPIIKSDLDIKAEKIKNLPREVISDGKIMKVNLKELNKDEEWLKNELRKNNIHLHLGDTVQEYVGDENINKVITNKCEIDCDLVVMAIGVKPNTSFIKNTDIKTLPNGAIIVDEYGKTSVNDIYAAGDCATIKNLSTNEDMYVPLATGANKLGRIVGENLAGANSVFPGSLASSCIKVLDMEAAVTGLTEERAKALNINYKTSFISNFNQTHYYPGREKVYIKLVYDADTKVLLGGQVAGYKDAVQRANVLATAITAKMTTTQLGMLDLCYAPPFATTWDVLNISGNVSK